MNLTTAEIAQRVVKDNRTIHILVSIRISDLMKRGPILVGHHSVTQTIYTERKKKHRVEFFPSYFNHFLRCLL